MSEHFDIAIVGGGAAGCVLARRLAEMGEQTVVLFEAGPDLGIGVPAPLRDGWDLPRASAFPYDWGFESEPGADGATTPVRRGRVLGGTSWLTRFAVRGAAADFDAWAARGNAGWSFADVLPTFTQIETDAEFGDRDYHGSNGPINITRYPSLERSDIHLAALEALASVGFPAVDDHNAPDAVGAGPMPMSTKEGRRVTSLDAYLPQFARPPLLQVRPNSMVDKILIEHRRAVGIGLVDGTPIEVGLVILSAGTYGSPTILMRSGVGPGSHLQEIGVDDVADLPGVGANLADHPGIDLDSGWRGAPRPAAPILHSIATFRSAGHSAHSAPDMMFWLSDPNGNEPAFYLDPILLKPESRGTVRLRSTDPVDKPRIALPALTEKRDQERLESGYELAIEVANHPSIRRLAPEPAPDLPIGSQRRERLLSAAYSLPHAVGTCRMGPSPVDGDVVDAVGRVHGISGLFVADASVIPEPPAGFPHLITIMLAERLAAALGRQSGQQTAE